MKKFTFFLLIYSVTVIAEQQQDFPKVTVYKSPTCGCCSKWINHLEANGFSVVAHDVQDVNLIKTQNGLPPQLASCHTALVDGYVVEGHVPAADIKRLLTEKPDIKGVATPGMPIGSPGMEHGDRKDTFDVVAFDRQGKTSRFSHYQGSQ
ncbi:MAG: DUF411 domain-containing protein [Methylococcales bacterium]